MSLGIVLTRNARRDIQRAIDWENERAKGLGVRFLEDLYKKMAILTITPFIGSIRYDNVRCTTTDTFQYLIHYTVDELRRQITIIQVNHIRRKPIN